MTMAPRTPQKRTLGWLIRLDLEEFRTEQGGRRRGCRCGEGLFEGVAGDVLDGGLRAEGGKDEDGTEGQGGGDPEDGGDDGGGVGFGVPRGGGLVSAGGRRLQLRWRGAGG